MARSRSRAADEGEVFLVLIVLFSAFAVWIILLRSLGTYDSWGALFWAYTGLTAVVVGIWLWKSIYLIRNDQALEVFFFGTHWHTYANGTLYGQLGRRERNKYKKLSIQTGHFADFCFLPWGIFNVVRFGTVDVTVKLRTVSIFTRSADETDPAQVARYPRLNLTAEIEMVFRFLSIRRLLTTIDIPPYADLTKSCEIPIYGMKKKGGDEEEGETPTYNGSRLTYILAIKFQPLVAESSRKAATYFNWESPDLDIQNNKHLLEVISLFVLGQVGSNFEQAGILVRPTKGGLRHINDPTLEDFKTSRADVQDFWGLMMRSVDLNIDRLVPAAPEDDPNEVNKPYKGLLTARERVNLAQAQLEEEAKAGEGRAQAMLAVIEAGKRAGMKDAETIFMIDTLKAGNVPLEVNQFGDDVKSLVKNMISQKTGVT